MHIALIFFNITQINLRHSRNLGTFFFVRIERPAARKLEWRYFWLTGGFQNLVGTIVTPYPQILIETCQKIGGDLSPQVPIHTGVPVVRMREPLSNVAPYMRKALLLHISS